MLAFLISSLVVGFVVTIVLPWANALVSKIPGVAAVTGNKFVQLLIVGAIVLLGLGLFTVIARKLRIKGKMGV